MIKTHDKHCVFCDLPSDRVIEENNSAFVIRDFYPVSLGHTLLVPKRHLSSFFDLSDTECSDIFNLIKRAKLAIEKECQPNGYNIGVNDGVAAGQTVHHLHVHLIPRFLGDMHDPRGGVRWIFPDKAKYWL